MEMPGIHGTATEDEIAGVVSSPAIAANSRESFSAQDSSSSYNNPASCAIFPGW